MRTGACQKHEIEIEDPETGNKHCAQPLPEVETKARRHPHRFGGLQVLPPPGIGRDANIVARWAGSRNGRVGCDLRTWSSWFPQPGRGAAWSRAASASRMAMTPIAEAEGGARCHVGAVGFRSDRTRYR